MEVDGIRVGVVGLGYVGLPLAVAFAKHFKVAGFDINSRRLAELEESLDSTGEVSEEELKEVSQNLTFVSDPTPLSACHAIIVTVPTPVDKGNKPDLNPLKYASITVGKAIRREWEGISAHFICYESTVYPGCTEEVCVPILEQWSGKKAGVDFFVGYSPERINPGDREHRFETIDKVVSGCCDRSLEFFAQLYKAVVKANIHKASSIKVAEASKVIENTQRDLNIALMNELSVIFNRLGISTREVLKAAATKWNFLRFEPGLVGGHCIGVDPYYLTYRSEMAGYVPRVILAGRGINDSMPSFIAAETVKRMISRPPRGERYRILQYGITFKENCPDIRNSKAAELAKQFEAYNVDYVIADGDADKEEVWKEYKLKVVTEVLMDLSNYDVIIIAVAHNRYKQLFIPSDTLLVDVKGVLYEKRSELPGSVSYWCL